MWTFIKKILPGKIIIRSWYWIEIENEIEEELEDIFFMIEIEDYVSAKVSIEDFHKKYDSMGKPYWLSKISAKIYKAEAMLAIASEPLIEENANK